MTEKEFKTVDQCEWVGNILETEKATEVYESNWKLPKFILKPSCIINTAIKFIKEKIGTQQLLVFGGASIKSKNNLPLIEPSENHLLVRLAIYLMRHSTKAQRMLSSLCSDNPYLYVKSMPETIYINSTLSMLSDASSNIDYELAIKCYLSLLDMSFYHKKEIMNRPKYERLFEHLLNNMNEFISNRTAGSLPNVTKSMLFLNCISTSFQTQADIIRNIFFKLFLRQCSDTTSKKYTLHETLDLNVKAYSNKVFKLIAAYTETINKNIPIPELQYSIISLEHNSDLKNLYLIYGLYVSMRNYLKTNKLTLFQLYDSILAQKTDKSVLHTVFRAAKKYATLTPVKFLELLFGKTQNYNYKDMYDKIIALTVYDHTSKIHKPHHSEHMQ